ncbi:CAP family protein [Streptomyces sp. JHA26]|uniref:CAP family protein n=1 Tax=Streptomyces sp. JHA26 TaxID=1917143 RepID=UPI0015C56789|nr:CAP family protein [Streptomyces sp. JHA26]
MGRLSSGVLAVAAAALTVMVTVQPVQAAEGRPPLPDATDEAFDQECLAAHNQYRARHGAPPLHLDDEAVAHATRRARDASTQDGLAPSPGTVGWGDNRFRFATYENEPASCGEAVRLWYEARWTGGYDWDRPGYSPDRGSFTQVVWKSSERLGCGRAAGRPDGEESYQTYIVCSYAPAGNVIGQFKDNVGEPIGEN